MEEELIPIDYIQSKIYIIRGKKVMLDRDLAILYEVETRVLNQAVKRNLDSFPEDFMFRLTREEIKRLSQFVISSNIKYAPNVLVFTDYGILMLSGVLKNIRARMVNIQIMRAFVKMREMIASSIKIQHKLNELESKIVQHDKEISVVFEAIKQLSEPVVEDNTKRIGFIKG